MAFKNSRQGFESANGFAWNAFEWCVAGIYNLQQAYIPKFCAPKLSIKYILSMNWCHIDFYNRFD